MKPKVFNLLLMPAFVMFISACSSNNSTKTAEPKVIVMDSISKSLSNTNRELDEATTKLEESIEKADKELKNIK